MSLLESLVKVSEKAANIARLCRQESHLFELLVEEKGNSESNPRFIQDFKTLADVLIQETVINDVGKQVSIYFLFEKLISSLNSVSRNQGLYKRRRKQYFLQHIGRVRLCTNSKRCQRNSKIT